MAKITGFIFVEASTGKEKQLLDQIFDVSQVQEAHLIEGEYDVLAVAEAQPEPIDPRETIAKIVLEKISPLPDVADTLTIIPAQSRFKQTKLLHPERRVPAYVLIKCKPGKDENVMKDLMSSNQVRQAHTLLGKWDVLAVLEFEKAITPSLPEQVSKTVSQRIAKIRGVVDTETYVPVLSKTK